MATPDQLPLHIRTVLTVALKNYLTILGAVAKMDNGNESDHKHLLHTIFEELLPPIEKELGKLDKLPIVPLKKEDKAKEKTTEELMEELKDIREKRYKKSSEKKRPYFSPLVLLLKLAEETGAIRIPASERRAQSEDAFKTVQSKRSKKPDQLQLWQGEQRQWGLVAPYKKYLESLKFFTTRGQSQNYWAGLPSCILSLVPVWISHENVITASQDSFFDIQSIGEKCRRLRMNQLQEFEDSCNEESQQRIKTINKSSADFYKFFDKDGKVSEDEYYALVEKCKIDPVHLPGILATWSPNGKYKRSCLLDYCRFRTMRHPEAEMEDQSDWSWNKKSAFILNKPIFGPKACAEWGAFLQLAKIISDNDETIKVQKASLW